MADFGKTFKNVVMKSMAAVGNTANNIANSTRTKVNEMGLEARRQEIVSQIGNQVRSLWQAGERKFPEVLTSMMDELDKLEEQLSGLKAERAAKTAEAPVETAAPEEAAAAPEAPKAAEAPAAPAMPSLDVEDEPDEEPAVRYHVNREEWTAPSMEIPGETDEPDEYAKPEEPTPASFADNMNKALEVMDATMSKVGSVISGKLQSLTRSITANQEQAEANQPADEEPAPAEEAPAAEENAEQAPVIAEAPANNQESNG